MSTIPEMDEFIDLIEDIAHIYRAQHVASVTIELGALCNISPTYFRQHFTTAAANSMAADAELIFINNSDETDRYAADVTLLELEVV